MNCEWIRKNWARWYVNSLHVHISYSFSAINDLEILFMITHSITLSFEFKSKLISVARSRPVSHGFYCCFSLIAFFFVILFYDTHSNHIVVWIWMFYVLQDRFHLDRIIDYLDYLIMCWLDLYRWKYLCNLITLKTLFRRHSMH